MDKIIFSTHAGRVGSRGHRPCSVFQDGVCAVSKLIGPNPYHFTTSSFPYYGGRYCLLATTGTGTYDAGNIQILVNTGSGFFSVADGLFSNGSDVLDTCFADILGVQVKWTTNNAWKGRYDSKSSP